MFELSEQTLAWQVLSIKNNRLISEIDMEEQRREVELEEHRKEKKIRLRTGVVVLMECVMISMEGMKSVWKNTLDNNREKSKYYENDAKRTIKKRIRATNDPLFQ